VRGSTERVVRVTATDARPSSIGEILDRAIATYVRRFVPLFVILALIAIPVGIAGIAAQPSLTHLIEVINQMSALPPGDAIGRARVMHDLNRYVAPTGWLGLFYLIELIVYPLARTALIVFAAETLDGGAPTIAAAYRSALRRWLPQVIVALAFIGIALLIGVGLAITGGVAALAVFAVTLVSRIVAIVAGIAIALVLFALMIVVVALGYIAWLMASVSVAVEDPNPVRAIGRGLRRTLDRPLLKRTLAVALAVVALDWFGSLAILSFAGLVEYFTHITLLYAIIAVCAGILLDGLRTLFVLIYMRDVQLRREGSDLLLAAAAPSPAG
jgi:hypothetical protein